MNTGMSLAERSVERAAGRPRWARRRGWVFAYWIAGSVFLCPGCGAQTVLRAATVSNAAAPAVASGESGTEGNTVKEKKSGTWSPELSAEERETLFAIAGDTLKWCVSGASGDFSFDGYRLTPKLKTMTATFVTLLRKNGDLRGCIGSLAPEEELYRSVHTNAVNASLRDHRFLPVTPKELGELVVHVSILSPIKSIAGYKDFKLGEQGIILSKKGRHAVFLPEVAIEQGWSVEDTLSHLSAKAGLPHDAWREGASFQVFESVVLSRE